MARSFSATALVGMLVLGLVIGVGGGYLALQSNSSTSVSTTTLTNVQTSTVTTTVAQTTTSSATSNTGSSGLTLLQLEAALSGSQNATLSMTSYNFGKGTLDAWIQNVGNNALVLVPQMVLYNGTYDNSTTLIALDPHVIRFGTYVYIPVNSTIVVQVDTENAITGFNSTLQILNNSWTLKYGTAKD